MSQSEGKVIKCFLLEKNMELSRLILNINKIICSPSKFHTFIFILGSTLETKPPLIYD